MDIKNISKPLYDGSDQCSRKELCTRQVTIAR